MLVRQSLLVTERKSTRMESKSVRGSVWVLFFPEEGLAQPEDTGTKTPFWTPGVTDSQKRHEIDCRELCPGEIRCRASRVQEDVSSEMLRIESDAVNQEAAWGSE